MRIRDWSSDVCSSDLRGLQGGQSNRRPDSIPGGRLYPSRLCDGRAGRQQCRLPPGRPASREDFVEARTAEEQACDYYRLRLLAFYGDVYYLVRAPFSTPRRALLFHLSSEEITSDLSTLISISSAF